MDPNRGWGYLNPIFCQYQQLVYNIFPHPQVWIQMGGGIFESDFFPTSVHTVGGRYLNPLWIQTLHHVLRLGNGWIQILPSVCLFEFESSTHTCLVVLNAVGLWRPWSLVFFASWFVVSGQISHAIKTRDNRKAQTKHACETAQHESGLKPLVIREMPPTLKARILARRQASSMREKGRKEEKKLKLQWNT